MMDRALTAACVGIALALAYPVAAQEPVPASTCETCHDDVVAGFRTGPHGLAMLRSAPDRFEESCVACHGPADAHVDEPAATNIRRVPGRDACAPCHPGSAGTLGLSTPGHDRHGVVCLDCHGAGHVATVDPPLLPRRTNELCGGCHQLQAAAFLLPFAHRDGVEPLPCLTCHSAHGQAGVGRLQLEGAAGACVGCHTGRTGPFVFPHPPRTVNGCVDCHQPHGSTNPRQLRRSQIAPLCLECHSNVPTSHDLTSSRYQACQTCHIAVHGSNRDPRLLEE